MGHYAIGNQGREKSKTLVYVVLVIQVIVIISLIRGLFESYKTKERVAMLLDTKAKLEVEHAKLVKEANYVASEYYLEKVAREELQRAKEGESVVIIPRNEEENLDMSVRKEKTRLSVEAWRQWWELLVK